MGVAVVGSFILSASSRSLHHDLKSANVLVSAGQVRLVDFGLSRRSGDAHDPSGGTLAYAAPAVLQQQPFTEISELFSVGLLAYELLNGAYPFALHPAIALINGILNETLDFGKFDLLPAVVRVMQRLVAKAPSERYGSASEAVEALRSALNIEQSPRAIRIRESYLQAANLVGREEELSWLQMVLGQAQSQQSLACLVGGESGVGKSRLLDEFRVHALVSGWQVMVGQIAEGGIPYQVWRGVLPHLLLDIELSDLEASILQDILPDIGSVLGREVRPAPNLNGEAFAQRLNLTIVAVLRRQKQPLVLILEDLHWISDESFATLKQLVQVLDTTTKVTHCRLLS